MKMYIWSLHKGIAGILLNFLSLLTHDAWRMKLKTASQENEAKKNDFVIDMFRNLPRNSSNRFK